MKLELTIKYALAIFLLMVGANKFFAFLPGMNLAPEAMDFMQSLIATGYMMSIVGIIEILCGLMLLGRNTTPLGLIFLAPISVNIILFHLFLDPSTIWMALFVTLANLYLLYRNRDFYSPILFSITNGKLLTENKLKRSNLSYN